MVLKCSAKIRKKNVNHRYFNFQFELPNGIFLIGSYLLPSFSPNTLENIAPFTCKKKLLIVISCCCPDYATYMTYSL